MALLRLMRKASSGTAGSDIGSMRTTTLPSRMGSISFWIGDGFEYRTLLAPCSSESRTSES